MPHRDALLPDELSSPQNPKFKTFAELLTAKGIKRHGLALMAGRKQIAEILLTQPQRVAAVLTRVGMPPPPELLSDLEAPWYALAPKLFESLDVVGTQTALLVVHVNAPGIWDDAAPWPKGCTLFVGLQNPENVGALVRTAAAFGVPRIVLLREAATPYLPKGARAAGPGLLTAPLELGPAIADLRVASVPLIALDAGAPALAAAPFPATFGLIAGVEGPGLPEHLRQGLRRGIPMEPGHESLNAATAVAIALYEWRRS